jgi:hypothetical protein
MENEKPNMTEEQRKEALEKALARIKPQVQESNSMSVHDRLQKFANKEEAPLPKENDKASDKPMSLDDLAKAMNKNAKESETFGLTAKDMPEKAKVKEKENEKDREITPWGKNTPNKDGKDDKDKDKDKDNDKEKEKDPVQKQEQKMKEMFSKVKLPSGMEIHQEGPQWVLVSKDGKQRTDVTDVMNTIDKYNRDVDAANNENKMQNEAQSHVDKAADVNKNDKMQGDISEDKMSTVSEALPQVKDMDGKQVFNPEDIEAVAKTALSASDEKAMLAKLKDTKALEEMQERDRKNNRRAEENQIKNNNKMLLNKQNEGR